MALKKIVTNLISVLNDLDLENHHMLTVFSEKYLNPEYMREQFDKFIIDVISNGDEVSNFELECERVYAFKSYADVFNNNNFMNFGEFKYTFVDLLQKPELEYLNKILYSDSSVQEYNDKNILQTLLAMEFKYTNTFNFAIGFIKCRFSSSSIRDTEMYSVLRDVEINPHSDSL